MSYMPMDTPMFTKEELDAAVISAVREALDEVEKAIEQTKVVDPSAGNLDISDDVKEMFMQMVGPKIQQLREGFTGSLVGVTVLPETPEEWLEWHEAELRSFAEDIKATDLFMVYASSPMQGALGDLNCTIPLPDRRVKENVTVSELIDAALERRLGREGEE